MLENIVNGFKKVAKKGKKAFLTGLAGLTLMYASGCSWKYAGSFIIEEKKRTETVLVKERGHVTNYRINKVTNTNSGVEVKILEDKILYKIYLKIPIIQETEFKVYYNPTGELVLIGTAGGILLGFGTIYALIAGIVHESKEEGYESEEWRRKFCQEMRDRKILLKPKENYPLTAIKCEEGHIKEKSGDSWSISEREGNLHIDKNSSHTQVRTNPGSMFSNPSILTNEEGIATFLFDEISLPYNRSFSKENLEQKLKSSKLASEIKGQYRINLINEMIKRAEEKLEKITVETAEETVDLEKVGGIGFEQRVNDSKSTTISLYEIPEEKIYLVLEDFINQEINSKIKEVRIMLIDESTHMPVKNANLEIETGAPSKQELAKQYFEDSLLKWSTTKIKSYITGQETMKYDDNGESVFSVYTPNAYKTESTHSNYAFAKFNFDFSDPKNLKQTIEMSQDPLKIKKVDK